MPFSRELPLAERKIARCRQIARSIGDQVVELVQSHSTVGIERAALRLWGFNGALAHEGLLFPVSNFMVDQLKRADRLSRGSMWGVANAMVATGCDVLELEKKVTLDKFDVSAVGEQNPKKVEKLVRDLCRKSFLTLKKYRTDRRKLRARQGDPLKNGRPLKYVIVATGNIFEDVTQAKSAVLDGADIIAVIRSTAQSLLDYVPQGTTTEGFGGTYATQANFRVMREALDTTGNDIGKYVRLTNYCSGLCMSEIAALAALEGLDCLLNDAMYGILFRDINPIRTLVDQHFSRTICGLSDIWIMTGEDNYMKTTDAVESGDQVLASEFINERTAWNAGVPYEQMSIGHAMEMNPDYENVILMEIARAQMTRQIFPKSPLKYMCNTKFKTGDIFTGHALDTIFNLIGSLTDQGTILLGMPTEAIHTPWLADRTVAIRSANYILGGTKSVSGELGFRTDGFMAKFAAKVLDDCVRLLERIDDMGFLNAIEKRTFAGVSRTERGGKGHDGTFEIEKGAYLNPFYELMGSRIRV